MAATPGALDRGCRSWCRRTWRSPRKSPPALCRGRRHRQARSPRSDPRTGGIYRSDDAGESWTLVSTDPRPTGRIGGGDLPMPLPHPKDPDQLVMASTVSWKSIDGGKSWLPFKGAPGGEDYQNGWFNPRTRTSCCWRPIRSGRHAERRPDLELLVQPADRAALSRLRGQRPYRVCSGQQESGSACVSSRGNYGAVSVRDWLPVGVDEYGYVAPDPLNPDIAWRPHRDPFRSAHPGRLRCRTGGRTRRRTRRNRQLPQVRTMPVVFQRSTSGRFFANNHLWKTVDGGHTWKQISPDLTGSRGTSRRAWASTRRFQDRNLRSAV